jgi:HEAT repeat protein
MSLRRVIVMCAAVVALLWGCLIIRGWFFGGEPWMRGVKSPEVKERMDAIRALEQAGRTNRDAAVPALLLAMRDPDAGIRAAAAKAMVSTMLPMAGVPCSRQQMNAAISAALGCLGDPDPRVRAEAAHAAWMVVMVSGTPPEKADLEPIVPLLIERLTDADASVRLAAIRGVGYVGPKVAEEPPSALLARLEDVSETNRDAVAKALTAYKGGLAGLLPSMLGSLEKSSPEFRKSVLMILDQMHGSQLTAKAVPGLAAAVRSHDPEVVRVAVTKLSELGDKAGPAAPELGRTLNELLDASPADATSADQIRHANIAHIVDCLGKVVKTSGPPWLQPPEKQPSEPTAVSTSNGASNQKEATAALAKALRPDRDPALRLAAARTLGRFHQDPAVFAVLSEFILDRDPAVRHAVIWSIHDLDFAQGYTVPKALATALEDASAQTRSDAAAAIGHSGMGVDPFFPALVYHALNDPDPEVRSMCVTVIHVLYPPKITAASVPHLINGLESPEHVTRELFLDALQSLRQAGVSATPAVIRLLRERHNPRTDGYCHAQAAHTLGRIAPDSPQADAAVAALAEYLQSHPDDLATQWTIEALAAFGPNASAAIPRIREFKQHKEEAVRKAATEALAKIQPAK